MPVQVCISCSCDSRIVEKAIDEERGEHARGVDCHELKRIDTCTVAELEKTTTTKITK